MQCLLIVLALAVPRLLLFFIWMLTDWFSRSFYTVAIPVLGILFMPYTTLAYLAAMLNNNMAVSGWWTVLILLAIIVDVAHLGAGRFRKRARRQMKRR